jgi:hypothetical protein
MIVFNGEQFPSMKAWKRAFPIYASYADVVRDGADTVLKLEAVIAQRRILEQTARRVGQRRMREVYKTGGWNGAG